MTQDEKIHTESEITLEQDKWLEINFNVQYSILEGMDSTVLNSPTDGFINILVIEGSGASTYLINNTFFIIRSGENILHPIRKNHLFEWKNLCEDNKALAVFIPNVYLVDFQTKIALQKSRFKDGFLTKSDQRLSLIMQQLLDQIEQNNHLSKLRVQSLIIEALVHQIEGLYAENEKHEIIANKAHYDKILLAKNLIHNDLTRNYTIAELAKEVGTNEQYLKKYFKQYFGKTVMNYITEVKMEHAKQLILTGEYRISDVARITGYKHSTHFTTAFKKYFGFIPNSLRYTFLIAHEGARILSDLEGFMGVL